MANKIENYIYGKRNVFELIKKCSKQNLEAREWGVSEVIVKKGAGEEFLELLEKIPNGIRITYLSRGDMDSMFQGVNHQGVVVLREKRKSFSSLDFSDLKAYLKSNKGAFLILDRIQDVGNLGNILRSAECFGFNNIIISERESAQINDTVERVSSGAIIYLKIFRVTNLNQAIEALKENGYWIVATSDQGKDDWEDLPDLDVTALMMGNEGEGIKRLLLENSDYQLKIPLHGQISSLNVVVATGVCMDRLVNRR